jgi:hypothetical protein
MCTKLTTLYWPNYGLHIWPGPAYYPPNAKERVPSIELAFL